MHVVVIGRGQWIVYAICTDEETCPLLDFVAGLDEKRGNRVLADLVQYVPISTPTDWTRTDFSWALRGCDSILEFRWPTKHGGTPRVLWFYDKNQTVVCSHGLNKKGQLSRQDIQPAERARANYLRAKERKEITVVELRNFDPTDEEDGERE